MPTGVYQRNPELRPQTFKICEQCGAKFGPVDHLTRKFCCYACKVAAQTTGKKRRTVTLSKARRAQGLLRYHIQAGHVLRPNRCEECGVDNVTIEAAHYDYNEPLNVRWLCISCHRKWDKTDPKGATIVEIL